MRPRRLLLVNPNTSVASTRMMLDIARAAAPSHVELDGATALSGVPLITTESELAVAGRAVLDLLRALTSLPDGLIVAAFGDPALEDARRELSCPVTGIAEAGMRAAAAGGRRFAVVTTTGALAAAVEARAIRYGHGVLFRGVFSTGGDPASVMADPDSLQMALIAACRKAVDAGSEAVVIGGGPLAAAARAIAGRISVPLVEPVPEAVRLAAARADARQRETGGISR